MSFPINLCDTLFNICVFSECVVYKCVYVLCLCVFTCVLPVVCMNVFIVCV